MAFRRPLYYVAGSNGDFDLQQMTDAQIETIQKQAVRSWGSSTTWLNSVSNMKGSFAMHQDVTYWKLRSGTGEDDNDGVDEYPAVTALNYTTSTYNLVESDGKSYSRTTDTNDPDNKRRFPLYYDGSDIRAMNETDFMDTFIKPAIENFVDDPTGDYTTTHYTVSTSRSLSGYTMQGLVYEDYVSNPNTTMTTRLVNAYYLHKKSITTSFSIIQPLFATSDGDIQQYSRSNFKNLLRDWMRYTTTNVSDYRVDYQISGGNIAEPDYTAYTRMGTEIVDNRRPKGTSKVHQYKDEVGDGVDDDIYYSLRYPTGSDVGVRFFGLYLRRY